MGTNYYFQNTNEHIGKRTNVNKDECTFLLNTSILKGKTIDEVSYYLKPYEDVEKKLNTFVVNEYGEILNLHLLLLKIRYDRLEFIDGDYC